MKKIAIALMAIVLAFGLAACDKNDKQPPEDTPQVIEIPADTDKEPEDSTDEDDNTPDDDSEIEDDTPEADEDELVELSEDQAMDAYKAMIERFEMESPVDVYSDVMDLLPVMPDHLGSILFAKFDKYMQNWSMSYSDQMYFEEGPMFRMDESIAKAYDYESDTYDFEKIDNATHKAIMESMLKSGFKFIWLEGSPYPFIDYSQFKVLGDQVPEEVMAFILVMSDETDEITAADAGLHISWNELASRAVNTENAMKIVENEELYSKLESLYRFYTNSYLLGMSNTPVVGWEDNKMLEEVLYSYEKTLGSYPDSELAGIIEEYMSALKTLDYTLPYSDQEKFQAVIKMQSDWVDEAVEKLHAHHNH